MHAPPDVPILLTADQIRARVTAMAAAIRHDFRGDLHLVAVLKGAFVFLADLARALGEPMSLDFLAVSSYADGTTTPGQVRLLKDLDAPLEGRDVLIVEDIVDTGLTLTYLRGLLGVRRPRSLRTATLLNKPSRRRVEVPVDYIGFDIDDRFVVGYGLDWRERYRELPYIGVIEHVR
jgi:hypoxanthine phosphoribosyltransferase